uniref:aminotransferase class V-fold PLP-dependent enzyme n=1 Tax=Microbacterium azadirachtae TaxID=582680 RepID=UPI000A7F3EE1|nr:aminotransferase class V-fold PLP-dependent enzyme [Microbacterium azadirachtae]
MIYLDHAATAFPRSRAVVAAVEQALVHGGSPGRSGHRLSRWSDEQVWRARERLARLVGAAAPENVTFALNATAALNTIINHFAKIGGVVLISAFEHNSVTRPIHAARARGLQSPRREDLAVASRAVIESVVGITPAIAR